jgi:hypothetical protein
MPFGLKNGPPSYYKVVNRTFNDYLDNFIKILKNELTIYNDMDMHMDKFRLCYQKWKKFGVSMNLDKCAFMVFSRMILGFIVSKKGKLLDPKKIQAIVQMPIPINP